MGYQKALATESKDRYPTVFQLKEDILRFLSNRPLAATPSRWLYRLRKWRIRHRLTFWGGLLVFLGLCSSLVALVMGHALLQQRLESAEPLTGIWSISTSRFDASPT